RPIDERRASPTRLPLPRSSMIDVIGRRPWFPWSPVLALALLILPRPAAAGPRPTPAETAARVDAALLRGLPPGAALPAPVDDDTFLRRVSLDLTGKLPGPDALRRFAADASPDNRARAVEELLRSDAYAVNWGRYWRDTLTYHTPASANYLRW